MVSEMYQLKPYVKCTKQVVEVKRGLNQRYVLREMHALLILTFMWYCEICIHPSLETVAINP